MATQWDKPMNFIEFMAVQGQQKRELKLLPEEWLRLLAGHLDSSGGFQNLLGTDGNVPVADATVDELACMLEGFYGLGTDKGPGEIIALETQFQTDAGGAATVDVTPATGASTKARLLSIKLDGTNLAGGSIVVAGASNNLTLLTDNIAKGRDACRVNILSTANTAITGTMAAGGNVVTYTVLATYRVEAE